jgi:DNA polymerase III delta prime subunit
MQNNPVQAYLDDLKARRISDAEAYAVPQEPSWHKDAFSGFSLEWHPSQLAPLSDPLPLAAVRDALVSRILEYIYDEKETRALLLRVPPGVGKTTASVQAAQNWALETGGKSRILYVSSRKNFFAELMAMPGVAPQMWYNWLPMQAGDDEHEETCRYSDEIHAWMDRGYRGIDFCRQMCHEDGWMEEGCPYRAQARRPEPIIFGRHAHLITGMAIKDYEACFVDEMPMSAFIDRRRIPTNEIIVPGLKGDLRSLFSTLFDLAEWRKEWVYGPELMRYIGPFLEEIYAQIDTLEERLPTVPTIYDPGQAYEVPYWYVFDLLKKLSPEYECWKNGWSDWLARVRVSKLGLLMLDRKKAKEMWTGKNPCKMIFLDATGTPAVYRTLFDNRDVIVEEPNIERKGKIQQVVGRLNGFFQTYKMAGKTIHVKPAGKEMLEQAKLIAAQYTGRVGIVTFKAMAPVFAKHFGPLNVLHYGGLRGSNLLESCECLILCGGYGPNMIGLHDLAKMLNQERMKPFAKKDEHGMWLNPWTNRLHEYRIKNTRGQTAWRRVGGYWDDTDLDALLDEFRRNEITQAIYRNRPIENEHDVWILTSIPTDVLLDGIYEDLSGLEFTPKREAVQGRKATMYRGVAWQKWLVLKPWLDEQWETAAYVTVEQLAEACNMTVQAVRCQRWRHYIDLFYKEQDDPRPWMLEAVQVNVDDRQRSAVLVPVKG